MTKFQYGQQGEGKCVAYICHFDDDPDRPVLVLKNSDGNHTYIYDDGDVLTQDVDCEKEAVHKFYRGDSVTITF